MKIAHVLNIFQPRPPSDLVLAMPVTLETMRRARTFAASDVDVTFYSVQTAQDHDAVPDDFVKTPDLDRTVMDLHTFGKPRPLPLLRDILDRLYEAATDADYLIYTNLDIALQPHFYLTVKTIIERGYDAFCINRLNIPAVYDSVDDIPLMYAEQGTQTSGYDCFVYKRDLHPQIDVGNVCIGAALVGRALMMNLYFSADKFRIFENPHLTFHIGSDMVWADEGVWDYTEYNISELNRIFEDRNASLGPFNDDLRSFMLTPNVQGRAWIDTAKDKHWLVNSTPGYEYRRRRLLAQQQPFILRGIRKIRRIFREQLGQI